MSINHIPKSIDNLISFLTKLPGIGPRTAQRLVFYLLKKEEHFSHALASLLQKLHQGFCYCSTCFNLAEKDPCRICRDQNRDRSIICVVCEPLDVVAIEQTGGYRGLFHVLQGAISPLDGIGPEDLKIEELRSRLDGQEGEIKEVILATNPTMEGEATALFLAKMLLPYSIEVTRIARGLPTGSSLEYADHFTLEKALEGRSVYHHE